MSDFLTKETQQRKPLQSVLAHVSANQWPAFLFGGVPRDLLQRGLKARVRDVDIVVDSGSFAKVEAIMSAHIKRKTRFGGLHMECQGWLFDMWSLKDTWAFRESLVPNVDFADLPRTTFMNVEAIVIELNSGRGRKRQVYSHGFFEAFLTRTVEINLEANPYPALCVIRALITANRLNFTIGPRLAKYIVHYGTKFDIEELIKVQQSHYGRVVLDRDVLRKWLSMIDEQYRTDKTGNVVLPQSTRQLTLWDEAELLTAPQVNRRSNRLAHTPAQLHKRSPQRSGETMMLKESWFTEQLAIAAKAASRWPE